MNIRQDYGTSVEMYDIVKSMSGRVLQSYLTTEEGVQWSRSDMKFILRFAEEDVEVVTTENEDDEPPSWYNEVVSAKMIRRPNRDVSYPFGKWMKVRQSDGRVKTVKNPRTFHEFPVAKSIDAVTIAIGTLYCNDATLKAECESGSVDFVRAVVLHLGEDALVFDRGGLHWSETWDIKWCKKDEITFPVEDAPNGIPELSMSVRLERFPSVDKQLTDER